MLKYFIVGSALMLTGCYSNSPEPEPTETSVYGQDYTILDNGTVEPINHTTDVVVPDE